jgi:hypothetical protein
MFRQFILLVSTIAIASFPAFSFITETWATDKPSSVRTAIGQTKQQNKSAWDVVRGIFIRQKQKGGTMGEFCSISPNIKAYVTWSDRPLFVWQGTIKEIQVSLPGSDTALWTYVVKGNEQQVLYNADNTGQPLQPGEEYSYWVKYETIGNDGQIITASKSLPFQVMEDEKRNQIAEQLAALENQNDTMNAEELALKRAEFFGEYQDADLFLDVVREVFLLESEESNKMTQEIRREFCQ